MSLRDQLLKAGIVDKKKVQETNRQLKAERKVAAGHRESRDDRDAREAAEAAARAAQAAAEAERRRAERKLREAEREIADRKRLIGNLLRAHRLPEKRGNQPFFHCGADGIAVNRLMLPESQAWDLRRGRLAVAWCGERPSDPQYALISREAAERVLRIDGGRILFFNEVPPAFDDPTEDLYAAPTAPPDWRARVATVADLARLGAG
jgi:uncharacterized protein YaiL (DUF2058 family)